MPADFIVEHRRRNHPSPPAAAVLVAMPAPPRPPVLYGYGPAPRPIRGELLCDEQGRFYEKVGDRVWPVQRFLAGPRSEVLDVAPAPPSAEPARDGEQPPSAAEAREPEFPHRTLWPEPGERRIVMWGHWRTIIARQVRHPARLRDGHRLAAQVQIYEITRPVDAGAWRQQLPASEGELLPLTHDVVARLGLALTPSRHAIAALASGTELTPGDRVARVQLLSDPTASGHDIRCTAFGAPAQDNRAAPPAAKRTAVPDRFLRPWEFVRSREDAAYRAAHASGAGLARRLTRRLRRMWHRADWQRWRTLLTGRDAEEQLWSVRPPAQSLVDPTVRDWARNVLDGAGYDAAAMLPEWEIFWRRKGL